MGGREDRRGSSLAFRLAGRQIRGLESCTLTREDGGESETWWELTEKSAGGVSKWYQTVFNDCDARSTSISTAAGASERYVKTRN